MPMNNATFPGVSPQVMGGLGLQSQPPMTMGQGGPAGQPVTVGKRTPVSAPPVISIPIQEGMTLSAIAKQFGTTVSTLQYMNGIKNPDQIFAGRSLNVPNPQYSAIEKVPQAMTAMTQPSAQLKGTSITNMDLINAVRNQSDALEPVMPEANAFPWGKALLAAGGAAAAPSMIGALSRAAPVLNKSPLGGPNLANIGHVAEPMARGAVASPRAMAAMNNIRPVGNNPAGVAQMIRPRATTIQTHPSRLSPEEYMSRDSRLGPFRGMPD